MGLRARRLPVGHLLGPPQGSGWQSCSEMRFKLAYMVVEVDAGELSVCLVGTECDAAGKPKLLAPHVARLPTTCPGDH